MAPSREVGDMPRNLRHAVNLHCRTCNDVHREWTEENDCGVFRCWLYPFRPGKGGEERVVRQKTQKQVDNGKRLAAALRLKRHTAGG